MPNPNNIAIQHIYNINGRNVISSQTLSQLFSIKHSIVCKQCQLVKDYNTWPDAYIEPVFPMDKEKKNFYYVLDKQGVKAVCGELMSPEMAKWQTKINDAFDELASLKDRVALPGRGTNPMPHVQQRDCLDQIGHNLSTLQIVLNDTDLVDQSLGLGLSNLVEHTQGLLNQAKATAN